MADKTFDVDPDKLVNAGVAIELEQVEFAAALQAFREGATQLGTGQGYRDAYNDVIRDVLKATGEAISAFEGLGINLGARAVSLGITAECRKNAPGVYVDGKKIASVGLRIRRGASYHGLAFNVNMDLEPFSRINPCGYAGLQMTQLAELGQPQATVEETGRAFMTFLTRALSALRRKTS